MARAAKKTTSKKTGAKQTSDSSLRKAVAGPKRPFRPLRWLMRQAFRLTLVGVALVLLLVVLFRVVNPPTTFTMWSEGKRLGMPVDQVWVDADEIAPVMLRSVVAAEDANFCTHWGFDMKAIREAIEDGGNRGASTISQQTVKNVYLWQGRSWLRKALEAMMTPLVEAVWPKRRILEVYLNVAEFDEGVFGVEAAAQTYFGVAPDKLSAVQAAMLAAILPDPKGRSASHPSNFVQRRAKQIRDGAATIQRDGRDDCFE